MFCGTLCGRLPSGFRLGSSDGCGRGVDGDVVGRGDLGACADREEDVELPSIDTSLLLIALELIRVKPSATEVVGFEDDAVGLFGLARKLVGFANEFGVRLGERFAQCCGELESRCGISLCTLGERAERVPAAWG